MRRMGINLSHAYEHERNGKEETTKQVESHCQEHELGNHTLSAFSPCFASCASSALSE